MRSTTQQLKGIDRISDLPSAGRRSLLATMATAPLTASTLTNPAPPRSSLTPEAFGATGDGTIDDAPAIQRAFDAAAILPQGATVVLQPRIAYRCNTGLVLDATRVSLDGHALLDFSAHNGTCLNIVASSVARAFTPANNYGAKGVIAGAIHLRGPGADTRGIGIDFASPVTATAAQLLVKNLAVSGCGTGVRFGARAYNNLLLRCEVFDCAICIDYIAAEDNGERNTLVGCTLFNSGLAVRMAQSSGALHLISCSLDYTRALYAVSGGAVLATSCHHESDRWGDRPIRCTGDGAAVRIDGGVIVNQAARWAAHYLIDVERNGTVELAGVLAHNLVLTPPAPNRPTAWATGNGLVRARDTRCFDLGAIPAALRIQGSRLSDPDFAASTWQDPIWRVRDTTPITGRYGSEHDGLRLTKAMFDNAPALLVVKTQAADALAAFVLMAQPVLPGESVLAGFRVRRDARRPGNDATLFVGPTWAKIDGHDEHRVPIIVRSELIGTLPLTPPADHYVVVSPLASWTQRTAPPWATHFCMVVDLVKADQASFLFDGLWADTI